MKIEQKKPIKLSAFLESITNLLEFQMAISQTAKI